MDGWPAWLLNSDAVTAGFFRIRHLGILDSYLSRPERHAAAIADARLAGGTFSDLAGVDLGAVRDFAAWYEKVSAPFVEYARAMDSLHAVLAADPRSLPPASELPPALRGRIEVLRSDEGFPAVRVLRGPEVPPVALTAALWPDARRRPSFGSTPRIAADPRLQTVQPAMAVLRQLAALAHVPVSRAEAADIGQAAGADLDGFLEPAEVGGGHGEDRQVRFLGHASVLIRVARGYLLTDPLPPATSDAARGLSDITCVLISHGHPDHFNPEALLPLVAQQPLVVVPRADGGSRFDASMADVLRLLGFTDVREVLPYEAVVVDEETEVVALPFLGEHGGLPIHAKSAFRVATPFGSVVVAADATGMDPAVFDHESTRRGTDLLCIGIEPVGARVAWLYGPLLATGHKSRGMGDVPMAGADAHEVRAIARALGAHRVAVYGTGAPGMEHILGRAESVQPRSAIESEILRSTAAADGLEIHLLETPGTVLPLRGGR
jgi:L-ascorbate metabolism protein UlaG (beta-lactamase superfamily)